MPVDVDPDPRSAPPPGAWPPARRAASLLAAPVRRFLAIEASSGVLLMAATAIALVWANSPWAGAYEALWHTPIGARAGDASFARPLHFWVNDGLMTIFFFVVGLEIRREIHEGELADLRRAALPLAAAIGGMAVPAAIYAAFNAGGEGAAGWGIPMATDIAFAVGVLTLLGNRAPPALRVLLLALAVIDDIGAILVIALFYSGGVELAGLGLAVLGLAAVGVLRAFGLRSALAYLAPGALVWAGLYGAGVHPTLAGVILGLAAPVRPWFGPAGFAAATHEHLRELGEENDRHAVAARLDQIEIARREALSPAERLLHLLHPWVAYAIMPLFALANAGVALGGAQLEGAGLLVFLGIVLGLAVGKPIGIAGVAALAARTGLAHRPPGVGHGGVALVGVVGGIGFTMSLFVAQLAFPPGPLLDTAKLAILVGSGAAMALGLTCGLVRSRAQP